MSAATFPYKSTGTVVIPDMKHPHQSTVCRPNNGRAYFDALGSVK